MDELLETFEDIIEITFAKSMERNILIKLKMYGEIRSKETRGST